MVKMLTVLLCTISNSQAFLLKKKNVSSFCKCKCYSEFFSKTISVYAIFDDQSLNRTLTNDIDSFEQLGPVFSPVTAFAELFLSDFGNILSNCLVI